MACTSSCSMKEHTNHKKRKHEDSDKEDNIQNTSERISSRLNVPRDINKWKEEHLNALSIVTSYQEDTTPLELLRMFPPTYYSDEGKFSESLRVLSNYFMPYFIDDIEKFFNEYCDFTNRLDNDIQSITSTNANILRHRPSLYTSKEILSMNKNFAKKQDLDDWFRRFEMCGLNFGQKLYCTVKKRQFRNKENSTIFLDPPSEYDFQFLFDAFASMFGLKSYDWYKPLMPRKTLQLFQTETIGKPDILYCQDIECESSEDLEKIMRVVAVCEVKEHYSETEKTDCRVTSGSECSTSSSDSKVLPPHISSELLGQHGGHLLLYYNQSAQKGVIFGLIIQETKVTFTALKMTEDQYQSVMSGKSYKTPATLIVTKAYDYMKKEERKHLIRPLLELALRQEVKLCD